MFSTLMRSRRFAPLFWCQFLSAFNDNFVRNMLAMLILFRFGQAHAGAWVTLAIGIFILPSIFLSALGGEIADSHDKALIAQRLKLAEIFVQTIAAVGFLSSSRFLLFLALFGLGVLSALFGPIKYGILPDHLETRELTAGNALIEGATFLAILLGLVVGGLTATDGRQAWSVAAQLMAIAVACWATSQFIPSARPAAPDLRPARNILRSTIRSLRDLRATPREWRGGLAVSFFWMTGAIALSLTPIVVKDKAGGGVGAETAISALFAIGVAAGSLFAAALARGRIFVSAAPAAALGMALFLFDLAAASAGPAQSGPGLTLSAFVATPEGLRLGLDVIGLAAAGGLFVVPIFAAVQAWAGEDRRARVVAAVNILNSIFMVAGSLTVSALQAAGVGEPIMLAALGAINCGVAAWLYFGRTPKLAPGAPGETHT
jgi:hypothetical protein